MNRTKLSTLQASTAGYALAASPSGRTRVIAPDGTVYQRCARERATLVIQPRTKGIVPLWLRPVGRGG